MPRLPRLALAVLVACALARSAAAQPSLADERSWNPQLFHPAPGPSDFVTIESARPLHHKAVGAGLYLNYARRPLTILTYSARTQDAYGAQVAAQAHVLAAEAWVGVGLFERLQIAVALPMTLYQVGDGFDGDFPPPDGVHVRPPRGFALGDPRLYLKVRLYGKLRGPQLAISHWWAVPLGNDAAFGGERHFRGFTGEPRLLAEWVGGRWRAGLSVGFLWRVAQSTYYSAGAGHQLTYGAAVAVDVIAQRLRLIAELYGHHDFHEPLDYTAHSPLELDVSARVYVGPGLAITAGVGTGVVEGAGTPTPRVFAGFSFEPKLRDRDHDGIADPDDRCPDVAEDRDGFQDDDGCPDLDDDHDTIKDAEDRCPRAAEDFDNFQDDDGCPEADNDKDGILDGKDHCPNDPEDGKAPHPSDGCPAGKIDSDGDGIFDATDQCPKDAEDKDGFKDDDGCPEPDNDEDGVPDEYDECPNAAEDQDGVDDSDGCPDGKGQVKWQDGDFVLPPIGVDGQAPSAAGAQVLDLVAAWLVARPGLKVRVEAFWDKRGANAASASQALANAASQRLVAKGVEVGRIAAAGYGVMGKAERRIEIHVSNKVKPAAKPAPRELPTDEEAQ